MNSWSELMPLAPVIIVAVVIMVVMIGIAIKRNHFVTATLTVVGLNVALFLLVYPYLSHIGSVLTGDVSVLRELNHTANVMGMFMVDGFARFHMALILVAALAVSTLSYYYIDNFDENKEELYLLVLLATCGAMLMVSATNMAAFFICLELLSIPMYGMIAYTHERAKSLEAGLKYLVLSATASAALLLGMAFIYAFSGSLDFAHINKTIVYAQSSPLVVAGAVMLLMGVAFKLSLAPFHQWTPDVYQGAPMPVTTFLATASKVAMLALILRFLAGTALPLVGGEDNGINGLLTIVAVASILVGNLLALRQSNLKRLLGYSSIAHMGYALSAVVALGAGSVPVINVYLAFYVLTSLGAFGVMTLMSVPYRKDLDAANMKEYRGLFWRRPMLASVLTVMMLSNAGIPLTVGFIGKFFVIIAGVQSASWGLLTAVIIGSGIGLYYYLRVMVVLFMTPPDKPNFDAQTNWAYQVSGLMVLLAAILVAVLGVLPQPLIDMATLSQIG